MRTDSSRRRARSPQNVGVFPEPGSGKSGDTAQSRRPTGRQTVADLVLGSGAGSWSGLGLGLGLGLESGRVGPEQSQSRAEESGDCEGGAGLVQRNSVAAALSAAPGAGSRRRAVVPRAVRGRDADAEPESMETLSEEERVVQRELRQRPERAELGSGER